MPTISSISGLRLMRPPPCLAVPTMDAGTETLSARAETNAVSRMTITKRDRESEHHDSAGHDR